VWTATPLATIESSWNGPAKSGEKVNPGNLGSGTIQLPKIHHSGKWAMFREHGPLLFYLVLRTITNPLVEASEVIHPNLVVNPLGESTAEADLPLALQFSMSQALKKCKKNVLSIGKHTHPL